VGSSTAVVVANVDAAVTAIAEDQPCVTPRRRAAERYSLIFFIIVVNFLGYVSPFVLFIVFKKLLYILF
jgi:hypothetical protein